MENLSHEMLIYRIRRTETMNIVEIVSLLYGLTSWLVDFEVHLSSWPGYSLHVASLFKFFGECFLKKIKIKIKIR